jgi:hypothetical protein
MFLVMLAMGVSAVGSAQANLVTNGDFSYNASSFTEWPGYFGDIGNANPTAAAIGWELGWGNAGVNGTVSGAYPVWGPASTGDVSTWGFLQGISKISQSVPLVQGQQYHMSLELAGSHFDDANPGLPQAIVQIGDGVDQAWGQRSYDASVISKDSFQTFSYDFTITDTSHSGNYYVEIYNNPTGDMPGLAFTNVSITATPEPSTLVLCVVGLISLVCYAWRKRK